MTRDILKILVLTLLVMPIIVSVTSAVTEPIGFTASEWVKQYGDLYKAGNYTEALVTVDKAIEIDPQDATAWYDEGQIYLVEHKYDKALIAYEKSLIIKPNGADAWNGKGVALTELGRYEEAQLAYNESLRLDPIYLSARENQLRLENKMRNAKINHVSPTNSQSIVNLSNNSTETIVDSFGKAMENNTTETNITNISPVNTSSEITKLNVADFENKLRNTTTNPTSLTSSQYTLNLFNNSTETIADSFGKAMENNTTEIDMTNSSAVNTSSETMKLKTTNFGNTSKKVETAISTIKNNTSNGTNVTDNATKESKHWWEFWK
jgi:tetratricopeptide (TPR) repeat protein